MEPSVQRQPFAQVASAWDRLAQDALPNPFLTTAWHRTLHKLAPDDPVPPALETVLYQWGGEPRALATLGRARVRRALVFSSRMLFLNETGDPRLDYLTVEHNAPLAPVGAEAKAFAGMVEGLLTDTDWDELCLGWVEADRWRACWLECSHLPLMPVVIDRRPYYFRGLQSRDARPDQLLSSLSSNTRQQIRRSIRQYGGLDALAFEVATDPAMAVRWFEHMVELHQARWQAQGKVGAFADPFMRAFHEHLIEAGAQDGSARMIRVQTSERVIGYLYNLRAGGYECNYQSGLAYEADPRSKPGLVSHILAMAAAAETGVHCYDFLVGESQYKRSLASGKGEMLRVSLQRRRPMLWLERQLRAARDRILQKRGRERKEAW